MLTTNVAVINRLKENKDIILGGTVLCIDPASNCVGYALYVGGKLKESGKVKAKHKDPIHLRLSQIVVNLPQVKPDLVVIELVRSSTGHVYMVWAVGAIIAQYGTPTIEIPHRLWKNIQDAKYTKDDDIDAIYMGKYAIAIANGKTIERKAKSCRSMRQKATR